MCRLTRVDYNFHVETTPAFASNESYADLPSPVAVHDRALADIQHEYCHCLQCIWQWLGQQVGRPGSSWYGDEMFDMLTKTATATLVLMISLLSPAHAFDEIDDLLEREQAPAGVVFEIISEDDDSLETLLPELERAIANLRQRFPDLPVAVVSHGQEQFALEQKTRDTLPGIHTAAEAISSKDGVELHVCGAHAGWYGSTPEDYPDYVDVSPSGPAQINDYRALGYELVVLP